MVLGFGRPLEIYECVSCRTSFLVVNGRRLGGYS